MKLAYLSDIFGKLNELNLHLEAESIIFLSFRPDQRFYSEAEMLVRRLDQEY